MTESGKEELSVEIDVIIPVHNAAETIEETVHLAMYQVIPGRLLSSFLEKYSLSINVCCYDDGSTDESWQYLYRLQEYYKNNNKNYSTKNGDKKDGDNSGIVIPACLKIQKSPDGVGRGAGYARNRAAEISSRRLSTEKGIIDAHKSALVEEQFLCLLDSDDTMHKHRIAEQVWAMMSLPREDRKRTLMGCKVKRDPPDSTWHYTQWANGLSDDRLYLERFREVTILQPTWMMCRSLFQHLGGYIEAPKVSESVSDEQVYSETRFQKIQHSSDDGILRLVHPTFDNSQTLRLAEDLRFFHSHLSANGILKLHRPKHDPNMALVIYRHRQNQSQSYQTSRKLLLNLRVLAFETCVLQPQTKEGTGNTLQNNIAPWQEHDGRFVVWGAGRDGKDFVKALSNHARKRVYCFVDVDFKKIRQGFYVNKDLNINIPIVHFSLLAKDKDRQEQLLIDGTGFGQIDKSRTQKGQQEKLGEQPKPKKPKLEETPLASTKEVAKAIDLNILSELPVVVCVAMYRTGGALERNVAAISRTEGEDLWHFS